MECVIFTGIQASGKSTFFKERFFDTHVRINLDMLRTRNREAILLAACLRAKQRFVVDNTNPLPTDRARYIVPAREARFSVVGYYFDSALQDALLLNSQRDGGARVPPQAVGGTWKRLVPPSMVEGYDALYRVRLVPGQEFVVEQWAGADPRLAE